MTGEVVHSLGAIVGTVLLLTWTVRRVRAVRRQRRVRRRIARLLALDAAVSGPWVPARTARTLLRRWAPWGGVVGAGWVLLGGTAGVALGVAGVVGLWWWRRRQLADRAGTEAVLTDAERTEAGRQLPLAADLLAACIAAGGGSVTAAHAVGEALGGPLGDALARGAAEVRLGAEPATAWRTLAGLPGAQGLARLLERADMSGLPAAASIARLAEDTRAEWTREATARARKAAVLISAPVGLCFLPAFIAVGVLPVVIGMAGEVLGGGG
ncbi:type II secretion system F family protein [Streptomyces sp. NPDC048290]|uniref:type II secretion system F family protein n=1 Tax=Streptomyces sp. NPDC048290 TaxID=3155811 RepID=UPI00343F31D4